MLLFFFKVSCDNRDLHVPTHSLHTRRSSDLDNYRESLSHQKIPKVSPPKSKDWGELVTFLGKENLPGHYPYTGGVYPYRRSGEDPTRMRSEEHTSELQSLMRISYAVFCLKKKKHNITQENKHFHK